MMKHDRKRKPNIIYIYADDLGRGMLSCYGQRFFRTPHIDRLAREGMRFTSAYGCALCAPARASLMTGYHDCHAGRWSFTRGGIYQELSADGRSFDEIRELINNTSFNERGDEVFLADIARKAGLVTGQIGKLEWGFATTPERIGRHGWDYHYGYYDHQRCHGFYPPFLWENGRRIDIQGNEHADCGKTYFEETPGNRRQHETRGGKAVYSQDLFNQKIEQFIRTHKEEPFFLYHPSQLPHGPTAVPGLHPGVRDVPELSLWEKEYASMILRLDDTVGMIYGILEELELLDQTLIIFSSDNGHESNYYVEEGRCANGYVSVDGRRIDNIDLNYTSELAGDVFDGNDGMSGKKRVSLEGGVRIPFIVRYPALCPPGSVSDHLLANYDTMATVAELLDVPMPDWKDSLSFLPALAGSEAPRRDPVVFAGEIGPALVTPDGWKVRYIVPVRRFQLFYLPDDYREERNLAQEYPDKLKEMVSLLVQACDGNLHHGTWENHKAVRADEYLKGSGPEDAFPERAR